MVEDFEAIADPECLELSHQILPSATTARASGGEFTGSKYRRVSGSPTVSERTHAPLCGPSRILTIMPRLLTKRT